MLPIPVLEHAQDCRFLLKMSNRMTCVSFKPFKSWTSAITVSVMQKITGNKKGNYATIQKTNIIFNFLNHTLTVLSESPV